MRKEGVEREVCFKLTLRTLIHSRSLGLEHQEQGCCPQAPQVSIQVQTAERMRAERTVSEVQRLRIWKILKVVTVV